MKTVFCAIYLLSLNTLSPRRCSASMGTAGEGYYRTMKTMVYKSSKAGRAALFSAAVFFSGTFLLPHSPAAADIVFLDDGSILTGKVVHSDAQGIQFKNSYGTFSIKTPQIQRKYVTASYREDIEISRKNKLKIPESDIRRNFEAGSAGNTKLWDSGRISVFAQLIRSHGRLDATFPWGAGLSAAFDQGPDIFFKDQRRAFVPGLRIEGGCLGFSKGRASIRGAYAGAGPLWRMSLPDSMGELVAGALPAVSFLALEDSTFSSTSAKLTLAGLAGWEYGIGAASLFAHARYMHIYDEEASLGGFSLAAGIGYRL